ncbi:hypothetical protein EYC84_004092 [Monilinia fructicola]|uniref:Uncharacterized protein n=1 Tax=Monilinia fructicola TaxID=38448 RepID=A0A5M9JZ80_MONFR|nr:hypothetical protein EYC84_004092 [Monilinia fructicola]
MLRNWLKVGNSLQKERKKIERGGIDTVWETSVEVCTWCMSLSRSKSIRKFRPYFLSKKPEKSCDRPSFNDDYTPQRITFDHVACGVLTNQTKLQVYSCTLKLWEDHQLAYKLITSKNQESPPGSVLYAPDISIPRVDCAPIHLRGMLDVPGQAPRSSWGPSRNFAGNAMTTTVVEAVTALALLTLFSLHAPKPSRTKSMHPVTSPSTGVTGLMIAEGGRDVEREELLRHLYP